MSDYISEHFLILLVFFYLKIGYKIKAGVFWISVLKHNSSFQKPWSKKKKKVVFAFCFFLYMWKISNKQ